MNGSKMTNNIINVRYDKRVNILKINPMPRETRLSDKREKNLSILVPVAGLIAEIFFHGENRDLMISDTEK